MGKTLFVTDLDGTLMGADSTVSAASEAMLNEAIGNGALFSIATARTPSTVSRLLAGIHTNLPLVVMTGVALWNPATGEYSDKVTIPSETVSEVMECLRKHNLPGFVYTLHDRIIDIYHFGPLSDVERQFIAGRNFPEFKHFHVPGNGISEIPDPLHDVILFYAMQPSALAEATWHDLRKISGCNPIFYHDIFGQETGILDVFSASSSKANAIARLKKECGATKVVAFGDNYNDLPMLKAADVAVAVENAVPEVKEAADIIIGPNTSDSVARYILEATR